MPHAYGFKSNDVYLFWEGLTCAPLARPLNINIRCRTPSSRYLKYIITKTLNHGKKVATSLFSAQLPPPCQGYMLRTLRALDSAESRAFFVPVFIF